LQKLKTENKNPSGSRFILITGEYLEKHFTTQTTHTTLEELNYLKIMEIIDKELIFTINKLHSGYLIGKDEMNSLSIISIIFK